MREGADAGWCTPCRADIGLLDVPFRAKTNACRPVPIRARRRIWSGGPDTGGVLRLRACRASLSSRRQARRLAAAGAACPQNCQSTAGRKPHSTRCARVSQGRERISAWMAPPPRDMRPGVALSGSPLRLGCSKSADQLRQERESVSALPRMILRALAGDGAQQAGQTGY